MNTGSNTHSKLVGYILWIFGFTGSHRFYYGKPVTGIVWAFTGGLFLIGWIVDFFLIPSMDREADGKYPQGELDYNLAWIFLYFLGFFGVHRFYMHKWGTGILWLCTFGLFGIGWVYDLCTLNTQVAEYNQSHRGTVPLPAAA